MFKLTFEKWAMGILASAVCMLLFAGLYDLFMGINTCIICWLQRVFLLSLVFFSILAILKGWSRGILYTAVLGILLDLRHLYVILFPKAVSHCIPMDFLLQMPIGVMLEQLLMWFMELGRSCSEEVDMVTYLLIPGLLVYYSGILLSYRSLKSR